jgi:hypothetical protein
MLSPLSLHVQDVLRGDLRRSYLNRRNLRHGTITQELLFLMGLHETVMIPRGVGNGKHNTTARRRC